MTMRPGMLADGQESAVLGQCGCLHRNRDRLLAGIGAKERVSHKRHKGRKRRNRTPEATDCLSPFVPEGKSNALSCVGVLPVIDSKNKDDPIFRVDDVENPEFADSVSPCIGRISFELLDIVTPGRLFFNLGVDISIKLPSQKVGIRRRKLLDPLCELFGLEYSEIRQIDLAWLLHP